MFATRNAKGKSSFTQRRHARNVAGVAFSLYSIDPNIPPSVDTTLMPRDLFPLGCALLTASLLCSCDSSQDRSVPARQAATGGATFQALAYADPKQAFGFDIRSAGLLPVRVSINNPSAATLKLLPAQTFLIDAEGQAWPLLTTGQAFARLQQANAVAFGAPRLPAPDSLDALTGFALDLSVADSPSDAAPESHIGQSLSAQDLRNPKIPPGQAASGLLFFPGQDEAKAIRALRLCYALDDRTKCLNLPLDGLPVPVAGR